MLFEVWAPRPRRVDLHVDGRCLPMTPDEAGWWRAEVADAGPGSRYGFCLDGGPARPDPRSRAQPDGVLGLSEVYDDAAFRWSDDRWPGFTLAGNVLYELHVGTFSPAGTFAGVVDRLPDLVDLGVDAIEVMPVAAFSGARGWGYDGVDLYAVHAAYGGPDGLKHLVDACHAHGLAVLLDVVYNHLGPVGNFLAELGPYFTDRHRTPWGDAINVDGEGSDEVRRFIIENACAWVRDFHLDGLRLDAVHAIHDDSAPHVVAELASAVHAVGAELGRATVVVAESEDNDPALVRQGCDGLGVDAVWSDDWHHAVHAVLTGERAGYYEDFGSVDDLVKALRQAWVYDGSWSRHHGRVRGAEPRGVTAEHFVVAAQTHDQVGNRARGERLCHLVDTAKVRIAAALLLTSPFTPMLFQGEEWAASAPFLYFTDHEDAELGTAVREGRRDEFAAFGWSPDDVPDPQAASTFERSVLDWSERASGDHAAVLDWYRQLLALRRREPALRDPSVAATVALGGDGVVVVTRGVITVAANVGTRPQTTALDQHDDIVLAGPGVTLGSGAELLLAPGGVAITRSGHG